MTGFIHVKVHSDILFEAGGGKWHNPGQFKTYLQPTASDPLKALMTSILSSRR